LDIGPGAWISIAADLWSGMEVEVKVGAGVKVRVGAGVWVGNSVGREASWVAVAESLTAWAMASAVKATTVGRYSGGKVVGTGGEAGEAQPAKSPRREARRSRVCFIKMRFTKRSNLQTNKEIASSRYTFKTD